MVPELAIEKTFNAPKEILFKAWGNYDLLQKWWQPPEMTLSILNLEFKPGGKFHYLLESQDGFRIYGLWIFQEIMPPDKLVFSNAYANENGSIIQAPFSNSWPKRIINELNFRQLNGQTLMDFKARPFQFTSLESATFAENVENIRHGLNTTFERLRDCIYG